jgi:CubicO group peptidase (beta-lactamase class C family)
MTNPNISAVTEDERAWNCARAASEKATTLSKSRGSDSADALTTTAGQFHASVWDRTWKWSRSYPHDTIRPRTTEESGAYAFQVPSAAPRTSTISRPARSGWLDRARRTLESAVLKFGAVLAVLVVVAAPSKPLQTRTIADRYQQKLQPLLERVIQEQTLPGFAIAVVENNRVAYAAGFGVRNLNRKDDPITTRSLFHMASITKPFVATALIQLVEKGKIDLDTRVVKYLPYFRLADERYTTITVRQLVSHTSGMPDVDDYEWDKPQYDDGALERYVRSLNALKLEFEPGERFKYSNIAFEILGDVIAKVSGERFEDYVQHHILGPLKMNDSTLLVRQADPMLIAWGHERLENGIPFPSKVYPYNRKHTPSSNLHSNALDMARWAMVNLNRGELDGVRILRPSTYDLMWTPTKLPTTPSRVGGISWFLSKYRGNSVVEHGGSDTGFRTGLALLPDKKVAVVWMTNANWFRNTPNVTHAAIDVALEGM